MRLTYLIICTVALSGANCQRMWAKEELNQTLRFKMEELEATQIQLSIHSNLSYMSVMSRKTEIFSKHFDLPRDPSLVAMGFFSSMTVIVLKMHSNPEVMAVKEFFTGQPTEGHILITFLKSLQPNRLVILIGRPNFLRSLSMEEEGYLAALGSSFISEVDETDTWMIALVTSPYDKIDSRVWDSYVDAGNKNSFPYHYEREPRIKLVKDYLIEIESLIVGRNERVYSSLVLGEVVLKSSPNQKEFGPFAMDLFVPIFEVVPNCPLYTATEYFAQAQFCGKYEGYGNLCSCKDTYIPGKKIGLIPMAMKEEIPMVIVTAIKPQTLFRLLRNLDVVRGSSQTKKLITLDGYLEETLALGRLFGIDVRVHKPQGNRGDNTRTNMNIGFSLWAAFDHFHDADKIILLEDDLLLSPDLLSFFHETSVLLDFDEKISHVSAFGQNSFPLTAWDLTSVLRAEMYPQYGWMTTKRWSERAFRNWVREGKNIDWDWWLFNEGPKMGFEAIVPEVSRTGHVGSSGAHVTGYDQLKKFHFRIMSDFRPAKPSEFPLERLALSRNYDAWIEKEIRNAHKIRLGVHPCVEEIFPPNKTGPFVLYLGVTSREDTHESFYLMQTCLGTEAIDVKEIYNGVMRLNVLSYFDFEKSLRDPPVKRKILYLVGCPLSKYCKYSESLKDWQIPSENILQIAAAISTKRIANNIRSYQSRRKKKKKKEKN